MDTFDVQDPALVECFKSVVNAKFAEAQQFPQAVNERQKDGGVGFVVSGWDESVLLRHWDDTGEWYLRFANETRPPYNLWLERDDMLSVGFNGEPEQLPDLSAQLDVVGSLPVFLDELVPFGWVENDHVIVIFYGDDVHESRRGDVVIDDHSIDCWVLEGEQLPDEMKMVTDDPGWIDRIKALILEGKLVRLSERIKNLPGEVRVSSDGKSRHYVEFDASDGQLPTFVPGVPYFNWHPLEEYPGEKFAVSEVNGGKPYDNYLKGWFR